MTVVLFPATKIGILAALALLVFHVGGAAAGGDRLCLAGPDGREECEAAYDADPPAPPLDDVGASEDANDEEEEEEEEEGGDWKEYDEEEDDWEEDEDCDDLRDECPDLAEGGECEDNPGFMKYQCPLSCGTCAEYNAAHQTEEGPCTDNEQECMGWAAMGECGFNPGYMLAECERSCVICFEDTNQFGVHQNLPDKDDEYYAETKAVIDASIEYMKQIWSHNEENNRVNYKCRNMHEDCSLWAIDECDGDQDDPENAEYVRSNCAPACQTCHLLDSRLRCPIKEGNELVFGPGGLNALFERIVDNADGKGEYLKYNPEALSRPEMKADRTPAPGMGDPDDVKDGPWVVVLENFVSDAEADALIAAGHERGYERSADIGVENPDGTHEDEVSDGRTSHNSWCDEELCDGDPVIGPVVERIAAVTGTTVGHSESLQLLRYEPGQYYNRHHDYIEYQQGMPCGVRMLTLFLYLNDVEEGGGTHFPLLDITVQPKKGSALLWPSVVDEDPEKKDFRTDHEALPVTKGIKYGANAWIHTRNYREAEANDCA